MQTCMFKIISIYTYVCIIYYVHTYIHNYKFVMILYNGNVRYGKIGEFGGYRTSIHLNFLANVFRSVFFYVI